MIAENSPPIPINNLFIKKTKLKNEKKKPKKHKNIIRTCLRCLFVCTTYFVLSFFSTRSLLTVPVEERTPTRVRLHLLMYYMVWYSKKKNNPNSHPSIRAFRFSLRAGVSVG